jgi:hypothetical protein
MKKIIYSIATIIFAFILSSFMYPNNSRTKYQVTDSTKSVNINVTAKNIGPYKLETNAKFMEALESTIEVNKHKLIVLKSLEKEPIVEKEYLPTTQEIILQKYGLGNEKFIVKRIRNDTLIKVLSILCMGLSVFLVIKRMKKSTDDWRLVLTKGFFIFISLAISYIVSYYILSYIFNNEFLTMKELINLLI